MTVATTRPETILGDTAVAVHPDDPRYTALVGRRVRIPFVDRDVPVIADAVVDPAFGTGAVKITPAHDHDDYETGRRHGLAMPTMLDDEARIANTGTPYDGLDRYEARPRIVADLEARGDLAGRAAARDGHRPLPAQQRRRGAAAQDAVVRPHRAARRRGARGDALRARRRSCRERFEKTWEHWMTNIRDWNVSRQLWWGHRIPAWYCPDGHVDGERRPRRPARRARPAAGRPPSSSRTPTSSTPGSARACGRSRPSAGPTPTDDMRALLPGLGDGDGLRHPVLLGRPDDDAGHPPDRRAAVPRPSTCRA